MTLRQRQPRIVDKAWIEAVASIEYCVRCTRRGVQVAHRDFGKGMGMKTHDHLTAALCPECHRELGEGKSMSREERRAEMDRAIVETVDILASRGIIGVRRKK